MDFALSQEQVMLKQSARSFLAAECPGRLVRELEHGEGHSPELWQKMARLGWLGLAIPAVYGGSGGNYLDLTVLLEELGYACAPRSFFSTAVLGGLSVMEFGDESQRARFLPPIASGEELWTLALGEPPSGRFDRIDTVGKPGVRGWRIKGTKSFVPFGSVSNRIVCVIALSDPALRGLAVINNPSPGLAIAPLANMANEPESQVELHDVLVLQSDLLGGERTPSDVDRIVQLAANAESAQALGYCQKALDMTVAYSKERVQFGRPIGAFQAVQHLCANALIDLECVRHLTYDAAWKLSQGLPGDKEVSMAKGMASLACVRVTIACQQIHGGIGLTIDSDLQVCYRRARASAAYFGDSAYHFGRVAERLAA